MDGGKGGDPSNFGKRSVLTGYCKAEDKMNWT